MSDLQYNFLDNNFTVYLDIESPEPIKWTDSINNNSFEFRGFSGFSEDGLIPIVLDIAPLEEVKFIVDNNPEYYNQEYNDTPEVNDNLPVVEPLKTLNLTASSRISLAKQFFINKGLTDYLAAGIVGNLRWESGDHTLQRTDIVGDYGKSFGMALWNRDAGRWQALEKFAKNKNKNSSDFYTQLEFIWKELQDNPRWLKALKRTKNFAEATNSFMINFENPNRAKANLRLRTKYAEEIWKQN